VEDFLRWRGIFIGRERNGCQCQRSEHGYCFVNQCHRAQLKDNLQRSKYMDLQDWMNVTRMADRVIDPVPVFLFIR